MVITRGLNDSGSLKEILHAHGWNGKSEMDIVEVRVYKSDLDAWNNFNVYLFYPGIVIHLSVQRKIWHYLGLIMLT